MSMPPDQPKTLFDKVWERHVVAAETAETPAILYVDLHLVHEVTSPQAFSELDARKLKVRRPDRTYATLDHSTPTAPPGADGARPYVTAEAAAQVTRLERNCERHGIELAGWDSADRGVVHVMAPDLGLTQPGMVVVCGDSHTATHGAFGALAFGIGTSEVGHVLATQCLMQRKPRTMRVTVDGKLRSGVSAKDLTLAVIARIGFGGGSGYVIEYAGSAIRALEMEGRMTLCNMSIEAGARAGMIAPDDTTFSWLEGRPFTPTGRAWEQALDEWRTLSTDDGVGFDREYTIDAATLRPSVTWGTNPSQVIAIDDVIPDPESFPEVSQREAATHALRYMGLEPGTPMREVPVDTVFIGSCTNSRIEDLRAAADVARGRRVHEGVRVLVVPGSMRIKA
jgi:3-isopropylmalate/(R)-2-methylmalate dehydratase large subunit